MILDAIREMPAIQHLGRREQVAISFDWSIPYLVIFKSTCCSGLIWESMAMRRDMDLVRKLIFVIEEQSDPVTPDDIDIEGYGSEQIGYHLYLMLDAGLIEGSDITCTDDSAPQAMASNLTWAGHEFADVARSSPLWEEAKGTIMKRVGSISIDLMIQYLPTLAK